MFPLFSIASFVSEGVIHTVAFFGIAKSVALLGIARGVAHSPGSCGIGVARGVALIIFLELHAWVACSVALGVVHDVALFTSHHSCTLFSSVLLDWCIGIADGVALSVHENFLEVAPGNSRPFSSSFPSGLTDGVKFVVVFIKQIFLVTVVGVQIVAVVGNIRCVSCTSFCMGSLFRCCNALFLF